MDPNSTLLWLVLVSCVLVLLRTRSSRSFRARRMLTTLLLIGTLVGFSQWPDSTGYIAGLAWFVILVLPGIGTLLVVEFMGRRQFVAARRVARLVSWVHPFDGHWNYPRLIEAIGRINTGRGAEAKQILTELINSDHSISWIARVLLTRITGDWQDLLNWINSHPHGREIVRDPMVLEGYLQALGETGRLEKLSTEFARYLGGNIGHAPAATVNVCRMKLAAFAGDLASVDEILKSIPETPLDMADYWRATACQAAGRDDQAIPLFAALSGSHDSRICDASLKRIQQPVRSDIPEPVQEILAKILRQVRKSVSHERQFSLTGRRISRRPWATWGISAALLIMFALEIPGGTTNTENLIKLGALVVPATPELSGSWRVIAAAFLHFGPMHLMFNLFGLLLFGQRVEKILGHLGLLVAYLTAAIGSVFLIPFFTPYSSGDPFVLVGASGGVMGLIGAILGFQLLGLIVHKNSLLNQEFKLLLMLIILQTIIDLSTPEISTTCHILGLVIGMLFGLATGLSMHFSSPPPPKNSCDSDSPEMNSSLLGRTTI